MRCGPLTENKEKKNSSIAAACRQRVGSEKGASISFALLLFLVCAVIGSVVLTAGTAAAGRFSDVAEYDQRYYSVTSAAELLAEELDGYTVTIGRSKIQTVVREAFYTYDADGVVTSRTMAVTGNSTSYSSSIRSEDYKDASGDLITESIPAGKGRTLLRDAAIDLAFAPGTADYDTEAVWDASFPQLLSAKTYSLTFVHSVGSAELNADELKLSADVKLEPGGRITIKLRNAAEGGSDELKYTLTLVLNAAVSGGNIESATELAYDGADREISTTTSTVANTIKWTVGDIY